MNVSWNDPSSVSDWNDRLLSRKSHSIFHSSEWCRTLHETYGYAPCYLLSGSHAAGNTLIPLMEVTSPLTGRRAISLPFTDYCDPLGDDTGSIESALQEILKVARKSGWRYVEFRSTRFADSARLPSQTYLRHDLDLHGSEKDILQRCSAGTRQAIRKAEREGIDVHITDSAEAMKRFYRLNCLTRREHGLPPQPYAFFRNLYRYVLRTGKGIIVEATLNGLALASSLFLHFGKDAVYKYGASDKRWQHVRPSNLVMWEGIRWYAQRGFPSLSLGRTTQDNVGLRRFKEGWGAVESRIDYFKYDVAREAFVADTDKTQGWHNELFRRLPLPLSRILGALLYRHVA